MNHLNQNELKTHVTILGWLNIGGGLLLLLIGAFVFMVMTLIGVASSDAEALPILAFVGTTVCGFLFFFAVPSLIAGFGLLKGKGWARILAIILGALNLMNIPIGTIIGIYTFWVLFQQEATDYFMPIKTT
jgi:hypothetical protein